MHVEPLLRLSPDARHSWLRLHFHHSRRDVPATTSFGVQVFNDSWNSAAFDEVVEARNVFGSPDYFLRIVVADVVEYEQFQLEKLTKLSAVSRVNSHQTMKLLKGTV